MAKVYPGERTVEPAGGSGHPAPRRVGVCLPLLLTPIPRPSVTWRRGWQQGAG